METKLYRVNGYWKDNKAKFINFIVCSSETTPKGIDDDNIFYYGLNEQDLKNGDCGEFIVTKYEEIDY